MNREKMRRSQGHYYQPLGGGPSQATAPNSSLEEENDKLTDHLKDKISALKSLTIDIGAEVKYQDRLLAGMDEDFERTGGFLGNTMNRVLRLSKGSHNYYILYIFLFSIAIFFLMYILLKFR